MVSTGRQRWLSTAVCLDKVPQLQASCGHVAVMRNKNIGEFATRDGMSTHTLRYYEKIGLQPRPLRDGGGRRRYVDADLARLPFIQRAQAMNFSLAESGRLLQLRERPNRRASRRAIWLQKS